MADKVFLRQYWSRYLGELRPRNDIYVDIFEPTPSPTPAVTQTMTPSITPSNTPVVTQTTTPSVTPSVTQTNTPSVTPSITSTNTTTPNPTTTQTQTPSITPSQTPSCFIQATGGTITNITEGGIPYRVHTFTSNGDFTISSLGSFNTIEYLILGGGGAGGSHSGCSITTTSGSGGGGAGGLITGTTAASISTFSIVIGSGGTSSVNARGGNGGNSTVFNLTAIGGGGGGTRVVSNGLNGGCGGGAGLQGAGGAGSQPGGFGTNGGNGATGASRPAGGGGGTSTSGATGDSTGNGGDGRLSSINGTPTYYGGGGGGGRDNGGSAGTGGLGGGGNGGTGTTQNGVSGLSNTGGGGGGTGGGSTTTGALGGNGGSGIVIIRYRTDCIDPTPTNTPSVTQTNTPSNTPICNNFVLGFQPYNTPSGGNAIAYSTNGINISGSSPNANSFLTFSNPAGITSIATNGSRWVAVGSNGRLTPNAISLGLYSNNGIQWFLSDLATVRTNANAAMEDVIWDGTRFLAIAGSTNPLTQSTDGITWTAITGSNLSFTITFPSIREAFIYYDGTSHWAGGSPNFYKSNGGNVYTAQTITGINRFYDMLYTQSKWILAGSLVSGGTTGKIFVSNDSVNWTGQTIPACTDVYTLVTNGNIIVAGGEGTTDLMYSYDGIGWTAATYAGVFTTRVYDLAWNGSVFMGVGGDAGQIGYSYDGINWSASTSTLVNYIGQAVASIPDPYVFPAIAGNCPTATPTPSVTQTNTPSITPTNTQTQTQTPSPTPTSGVTGCLCYRLLNETGSPINYQYDDCVLGATSGTLSGGASTQVCAVDLPVIDPGGTITPCTSVTNCDETADCTGCS